MGQVVTGGRLEVTALGDEVNECARIEQSAAGGALLASKALIERLEADDAAAVGLEPAHMAYRALGDLDGADEKAVRDAGLIAVSRIDTPLAS
jgi:class 3 adenylate cyclase